MKEREGTREKKTYRERERERHGAKEGGRNRGEGETRASLID